MKILVVDDDIDTREFIAFLLEKYGANVTAVASANEALAALTQSLPDIFLSDKPIEPALVDAIANLIAE
ncbi:MAG: response regulator [Nostoc sp.]